MHPCMCLHLLGVLYVLISFIVVMFMGYGTSTKLIILDILPFDIILKICWFSRYHAIHDCYDKSITRVMYAIEGLEWKSNLTPTNRGVDHFYPTFRMIVCSPPFVFDVNIV